MRKEPEGTLRDEGKVLVTDVTDRIAQLALRYPSRSAAARAWGVNRNTLNSYYKNAGEPPMPRENLLMRIAESEGVTLEWLKYGGGESRKSPIKTKAIIEANDNSDHLTEVLSFLSTEERFQLATVLVRRGIETILCLLDKDNIELLKLPSTIKAQILDTYIDKPAGQAATLEESFRRLPREQQERAMELIEAHEDAKKGASADSDMTEQHGPDSEHKRAG